MSTLDEIRARNDNQMRMGHRFAPGSVIDDRRTLLALLDAQSLELQAVREALEKYGQHNTGCDEGVVGYIDGRPDHRSGYCSCGFRAALKQSRGAT